MANYNQIILLPGLPHVELQMSEDSEGVLRVEKLKECAGQIALFGEGSIPSDRHLSSVK